MAEIIVSPGRIASHLFSLQCQCEDAERSLSPIPTVISVFSSLVEQTLAKNERLATSNSPAYLPPKYRVFDSVQVPDMSIERYLERILKNLNCSSSVFVTAYAYIDFSFNSILNSALRLPTSTGCSKFLEHLNYRNSYYARVGGVNGEEINRIEMELLFLMGFKLQVSVDVLEIYCRRLEREVALGGGFQIERTLPPFVFPGATRQKLHCRTP